MMSSAACAVSYASSFVVRVAKRKRLTLSLDGADLAGVSPALARHPGAAARLLRYVCRFRGLAAPVLKLGVAVVHSHILQLTKTNNKSGVKLETPQMHFLCVAITQPQHAQTLAEILET